MSVLKGKDRGKKRGESRQKKEKTKNPIGLEMGIPAYG